MFDTIPDGLQANYTATLSYASGNPVAPEETRDVLGLMTDHLMVPVEVIEEFTPTTSLELDVWFDAYDNGVNRASMLDNITYVSPEVPSLMSMLSMGNDSNNINVYGQQTAAHMLPKGEVMNLTVINFDANAHPFHLHGHNFQVTRGTSSTLPALVSSPESASSSSSPRKLISSSDFRPFSYLLAVTTDFLSNDTDVNPVWTGNQANPMRELRLSSRFLFND